VSFPEIEYQRPKGEGLNVSAEATPLDFLCAIFRDPRQPMERRLRAAREAAPFVHPTYRATATVIMGDDFAARLEKAIERSRAVRLIEQRALEP
jgi:hypothetical protein